MTLTILPQMIQEYIMELAGVNLYWKRRFSNDILPLLNKGHKNVNLNNGSPCSFCYLESIKAKSDYCLCYKCENQQNICYINMNWEDFYCKINKHDIFIKEHAKNGYHYLYTLYSGCGYYENHPRVCIVYEINRGPLDSIFKPIFRFLRQGTLRGPR